MNCEARRARLNLRLSPGVDLNARGERGEAEEVALVLRQILDLRRRDVRRDGCVRTSRSRRPVTTIAPPAARAA